jgi:hypothetical protein
MPSKMHCNIKITWQNAIAAQFSIQAVTKMLTRGYKLRSELILYKIERDVIMRPNPDQIVICATEGGRSQSVLFCFFL